VAEGLTPIFVSKSIEHKAIAPARTNLVYSSKGRQAIMAKLDRIHVDRVSYDSRPLSEVISELSAIARERDPDHNEINFFISREAPTATTADLPGTIDPATGLPVTPLPTDVGAKIGSVSIRINPPLENLRLADALAAIVKSADTPIKYSILDYAVVFSLRNPNEDALEIRTFHVDPNTFREHLEELNGLPGGSLAANGGTNVISSAIAQEADLPQASMRKFFGSIGVNFDTNNLANVGKSFMWNNGKGILTVRATASDLDLTGAAIETLNLQQRSK
jgi:hypothetical protein